MHARSRSRTRLLIAAVSALLCLGAAGLAAYYVLFYDEDRWLGEAMLIGWAALFGGIAYHNVTAASK